MRICFLTFSILSFLLLGCVSTRHVHDYTQKTLMALEKFEEIPISQQQVNKKEFDLTLVRKASILTHDEYNQGLLQSRNYIGSKDADSITQLIYTVCLNYFEALDNLSEKSLGAVKMDPLSTAISKGNFGGIGITEENMKSYNRLANQIGNAITGTYRLKKLREHVREGNAPLQAMLSKLHEIVSENYLLNIEKERQNLQALYFEFSKDSSATGFERKNITQEYYTATRRLSNTERQVQIYGKALTAMMKVHQRLHDNLDQIKNSQLRKELAEYGSTLKVLIATFNKLQN
ncbi:MAG: hypothetical protein WKF97_15400 [Chitinophagaceae bacterium]